MLLRRLTAVLSVVEERLKVLLRRNVRGRRETFEGSLSSTRHSLLVCKARGWHQQPSSVLHCHHSVHPFPPDSPSSANFPPPLFKSGILHPSSEQGDSSPATPSHQPELRSSHASRAASTALSQLVFSSSKDSTFNPSSCAIGRLWTRRRRREGASGSVTGRTSGGSAGITSEGSNRS